MVPLTQFTKDSVRLDRWHGYVCSHAQGKGHMHRARAICTGQGPYAQGKGRMHLLRSHAHVSVTTTCTAPGQCVYVSVVDQLTLQGQGVRACVCMHACVYVCCGHLHSAKAISAGSKSSKSLPSETTLPKLLAMVVADRPMLE